MRKCTHHSLTPMVSFNAPSPEIRRPAGNSQTLCLGLSRCVDSSPFMILIVYQVKFAHGIEFLIVQERRVAFYSDFASANAALTSGVCAMLGLIGNLSILSLYGCASPSNASCGSQLEWILGLVSSTLHLSAAPAFCPEGGSSAAFPKRLSSTPRPLPTWRTFDPS